MFKTLIVSIGFVSALTTMPVFAAGILGLENGENIVQSVRLKEAPLKTLLYLTDRGALLINTETPSGRDGVGGYFRGPRSTNNRFLISQGNAVGIPLAIQHGENVRFQRIFQIDNEHYQGAVAVTNDGQVYAIHTVVETKIWDFAALVHGRKKNVYFSLMKLETIDLKTVEIKDWILSPDQDLNGDAASLVLHTSLGDRTTIGAEVILTMPDCEESLGADDLRMANFK